MGADSEEVTYLTSDSMQFPLDQIRVPSSQVPGTAQAAGTGLKEDSFALNALDPFGGSINIDDLSTYHNGFDLLPIPGNTGLFSEAQIDAIVQNFDWQDMEQTLDGGSNNTDLLDIPKLSRSSTADCSQTTLDSSLDLPTDEPGAWETTAWQQVHDDAKRQLYDGSLGDWFDPIGGFIDLDINESAYPLQMGSIADLSSYSNPAFAIRPDMSDFDGSSWCASVSASRMVDASAQTETSTGTSVNT